MSEEPEPRFKRVAAALDDARRELIDISRRNRLLHAPRSGRRVHCLEFANVDPDAVFAELVGDGKAFAFAPEENPKEIPETETLPRTLPIAPRGSDIRGSGTSSLKIFPRGTRH
jgi:hypothetical protein